MTVISAAIEENGWVLALRGDWSTTLGAWDFGGFDRTNGRFLNEGADQFPLDPDGDPKILLDVTDAGFDRLGALPVANPAVARRIVGTKLLRRPWPNQAQLDETDHGDGTRTVRVALSDRVFQTSAISALSLSAGWKSGEGSAAFGSISNLSTRIVQLPVSRWATVPYQLMAGTTAEPRTSVRVDILVASHFPMHLPAAPNQPVAAVSVKASDGVNSGAVSWLSLGRSAEKDGMLCWTGEVDVAGLTAGVISLHHTVFPFIGAARSTGSGHTATATASAVQDWAQPLQLCFDPVGARWASTRKYVFIDTTSPNTAQANSGSVVLHADVDSARAAPASSKPANITVAFQAFRDQGITYPSANGLTVAAGRGNEFWEILIHEGQTVEPISGTVNSSSWWGARHGWLVIRGDPAAANPRESCGLQSYGSAASGASMQKIRITGLRLKLGHSAIFANATDNMQWVDDCDVTAKPGYAGNAYSVRATGGLWTTNLKCWGYNSQPAGANLQRNIHRSVGARSLCHANIVVNYEEGINNTSAMFDVDDPDSIVWNFRGYRWNSKIIRADDQTSPSGTLGAFGSPHLLLRAALVNVCVEGDDTRLLQLGEESYTQMNDCIWDGVTIVGDGVNFHNEPPWPLQWASGQVSVGLLNHGLSVGDSVTISGSTPVGYDGTYTVSAIQGANRFTYAKSTDPGTMTRRGTIALPGGEVRTFDFWNLCHTGNTILGTYLDRNATKNDVWRPDSKVIGNWETVYGVGMRGKVHANRIAGSPQDWQYAFHGLGGLTNTDYSNANGQNWAGFENDASGHDGRVASWNGDYRPGPGSLLLGRGRISNTNEAVDGTVRGEIFPAGAFGSSYQPASQLGPTASFHDLIGNDARLSREELLLPAPAAHQIGGDDAQLIARLPEAPVWPSGRTLFVEREVRTVLAARN